MRTVTLELLRHGPPHNQLLSPLTPYLALCENHAPVTLNVPFEHNQFLHRLSALTYELEEKHRHFQLHDTGRELARLLGAIPGLTAELSRDPGTTVHGVTHLRLVLSASELALLPFELALAANGFPGAGQPLLLQSEVPLCLTREVRRVSQSRLRWTSDARVLFICASPVSLPAVPVESHLLALRRAIAPWVGYYDSGDDEARRKAVDKHLKVLPRASIDSIEQECATGKYTHIHILAHGLARSVGFDVRFGLALHNDANPDGDADVVSGERLATALRAIQRPDRDALVRPMVVTLASCNSGNIGSVVGVGASIAHALQEAGIPLVIAGQFPLTFGGSVKLVELMYEGLLWGVDPREMLMDLRLQLHTHRPDNHDWAALTAYASLPVDFDNQLSQVQVDRAMAAVVTSMDFADQATRRMMTKRGRSARNIPFAAGGASSGEVLAEAHRKIDFAKGRLESLANKVPEGMRSEVLSLLASANKRHAEVVFYASTLKGNESAQSGQPDAMQLIQRARIHYWRAFRSGPDSAWALVQYVALTKLLSDHYVDRGEPSLPERRGRTLRELWQVAETLSLNDLDSIHEKAAWAPANLLELALLAMLLDIGPSPNAPTWDRAALSYFDRIPSVDAPRISTTTITTTPSPLDSARRQLIRYADWYPRIAPNFSKVGGIVEQLLESQPED